MFISKTEREIINMRLWHKDLINVLPRQQLLAQWRECCCIARNIAVNGTPNHILVNKVMDYPISHFYYYAKLVAREMESRGYNVDFSKFTKHFDDMPQIEYVTLKKLFREWHNNRYYNQCFYNLQEKYDCGGITEEEWDIVLHDFNIFESL